MLCTHSSGSLAQHSRGYLDIGGIGEIAENVAAQLVKHAGLLLMPDPIKLSDVSARYLSVHDGATE